MLKEVNAGTQGRPICYPKQRFQGTHVTAKKFVVGVVTDAAY